MNYKGLPLFGEDSSPHNTSEFFAIAGTALFWLIFMLCMIFVHPKPQKPKYKEVQIVLSSTPVVKETEANPAPAAAAAAPASDMAPVADPAPVVEKAAPKVQQKIEQKVAEAPKVVEAPKPKPQPKPAPAPVPVQSEPIEYAVDPMEAFAQQTKKQPKQEFNWDMFDDDATETSSSSSSQSVAVKNDAPAFEGSAGQAAIAKSPNLTSQTTANGASQNNSVSKQTSSALSGIADTKFLGKAANGVTSESQVKTKASGTGAVALEMSNGSMRALIRPSSPVINLSPEAAATIDSSRIVTIKFRVVEAGNVPLAEISIEPESSLAQIVRNEIRDQVSEWLFESADYSAYASFTYKIVKQ